MNTELTGDVLERTIEMFRTARMAVADAIASLYEVYKTEAWEGRYGSWSEFCEDGLQISKSLGSQYVAVYEYYVEHGSLTVEQIREADIGKLYLALGTEGAPEEKLNIAKTLSRGELKEMISETKNPNCAHANTGVICFDCHKRI